MLTVVMPLKGDYCPALKQKWIKIFDVIVIRGGTMWEARKKGIEQVKTKYCMMLDDDNIVPFKYVLDALVELETNGTDVVAIDYDPPMGHLAFGCSIWRTNVLRRLYDYKRPCNDCECIYMWGKIHRHKYKLRTLPYKAIHLKKK